jgi:hypothetical protein
MTTMTTILNTTIVSLFGIISALITDYIVKRLREKKNNIWAGKQILETDIYDKYYTNYRKAIHYKYNNKDVEKKIINKGLYENINSFFSKCFDDRESATKDGTHLLNEIKRI